MVSQEILVHVTAPSRLRDDRRYQSLAAQLVAFETASMTRVYGFVGQATKRNLSNTSAEAHLSFYQTTSIKLTQNLRTTRPSQVEAHHQVEVSATPTAVSNSCMSPARGKDSLVEGGNFGGQSDDTHFENIVQETPFNRLVRDTSLEVDSQGRHRVMAKRLDERQVVKGQAAETMTSTRHISNNPPYKNPFHGQRLSDTVVQTLRTPQLGRPRTAPAGCSNTLQVPRTLNSEHKRSASDSFLGCSYPTSSAVSDSQPSTREGHSHVPSSQQDERLHRAATEPLDTSFSIDSPSITQTAKRRRIRVNNSEDSVMEDTNAANTASVVPVESSFERNFLFTPPPVCNGPCFLRDRSEDWKTLPGISATNSSSNTASSTLSPSQPLALRLSQTRISPQTSGEPSYAVDLTLGTQKVAVTERREKNSKMNSSPPSSQDSLSPRLPSDHLEYFSNSATKSFYGISSPVANARHKKQECTRKSSSQGCRSSIYDLTSSIRSLPDWYEAPLPPIGSGPFRSHISTNLSSMISRLPLSRHFRPVKVTRDVHVLERGHWSIRVKIASDEEVVEARRAPTRAELLAALNKQMAGASPMEKEFRYQAWKAAGHEATELGIQKRCDLWTEAEFLSFWEILKGYVEEGKAGHHLSVTKDWPEEATTAERSTQSTYARIRVYTWGEVLAHVWVALWVLSDKKIAYIPMEWIASDNSVVVRMSGNRYKGGKLDPWVPKGSPGGKGSWGIEAGTPPGNQGKYIRLPSS